MLEKRLEAKGFVALFWSDTGWVRFFSKDPVIGPDDLRKTKLFVEAGSPAYVDLYPLGAVEPRSAGNGRHSAQFANRPD